MNKTARNIIISFLAVIVMAGLFIVVLTMSGVHVKHSAPSNTSSSSNESQGQSASAPYSAPTATVKTNADGSADCSSLNLPQGVHATVHTTTTDSSGKQVDHTTTC